MKKILLLATTIILVGAGCQKIIPTAPQEKSTSAAVEWLTAKNSTDGYAIDLPQGTKFCVSSGEGADCTNKISKSTTNIDGVSAFLINLGLEFTDSNVEISVSKNGLKMSAVDFAKRSLKLNQEYDRGSWYSDAKEISFAGVPAYSFLATGGFVERGRSFLGADGFSIDDPTFYEKAGEGRVLSGAYRVIYFDHAGLIYRIIYPANDEIIQQAIDSFKFIKK